MPGVAFGSSKLLLKNNAYIANKLDIGRTANENYNAYITKKLDIGRINVGKGTAAIGHTLI
jgi:hypothetical protein